MDGVEDGEKESLGAREPDVGICEIDGSVVEKVRREIPLLRRTDVYPEV